MIGEKLMNKGQSPEIQNLQIPGKTGGKPANRKNSLPQPLQERGERTL
jgi:hypothetical protein